MILNGNAQPLEHPGSIGLRLPAAQLGKLRLQLCRQDAVLVGEVLFFVERILLLADVIELLVAHNHGVQHGIGVVLELILLQNGHPNPGLHVHVTVGGLDGAGENLQQGGLARTVGTDDAVAVAGVELQIGVFEQHAAAVLYAEIGYCNHFIILIQKIH